MKIVKRSEKRFNYTCEKCGSIIQLKKTEALPNMCPACNAESWTGPSKRKEITISNFGLRMEAALRKAEIRRSLRRARVKNPD